MAFGPLVVITGLGILGLLVAKKAGASPAAPGSPGSPELPPSPRGGTPPFVPGVPAESDMPASLKDELARALQLLTVDPSTGLVTGPVTEDAIRNATALASRLRTLGFPEAAQALEEIAKQAAKSIPSPPKDKQAPLPGVSPAIVDQLNRALKLERDPKKLRAIVETLKKLPPSAERDAFIATFEALILQVEAEEAEKEALRRIEDTIKDPSAPRPEPVTPPFVPGPSPTPPSPAAPAPQAPTSKPRVVQVLSGDGFIKITRRLEQPDARWPELRNRNVPVDADGRKRAKDTDKAGGIKPALQPGNLLFVPENWPVAPGVPIPAPSPAPAIVTPAVLPPAPPSGPRATTVQSGDGLIKITRRLGQPDARWTELRDANIPADADGRKRSRDSGPAGIKPGLQPGHHLFVPASWPVTATAGWNEFSVSGEAAVDLGASPIEIEPIGNPKSEAELAAGVLVAHLLRLQNKFGVQKARRKADKRHIARFEEAASVASTGEVTASALIRAAALGESVLPLVMHWSSPTEPVILRYKQALRDLASEARSRGEEDRARALEESARREGGQAAGFLLTGAPVSPARGGEKAGT